MKNSTRRDFLKCAGIGGGALLLSNSAPAGILKNVFAEEAKELLFTAQVAGVDIGIGRSLKAWTYNGAAPGPQIRIKEGETLRVLLKNGLPEETTIHWHGVPVPNKMDGVPDVTQKPVQPGQSFAYEFKASLPGTYMYHTHVSYQLDRGLSGALIVEPKKEERSYDREYILLLDDWAAVDGGGPEASRMGRVRPGMGMMGRDMMGRDMMGMMRGMGGMMGRDRGAEEPLQEPVYDAYTINGKVFGASPPFMVKKGDRVRLRVINPSAATIFTLRVAGHALTITHTDGRPVVPYEVDAVRIGMGERYDVEVLADNPGRWHIYNVSDGSPVSGWPLGRLLYQGIESKTYNDDRITRFRVNNYSDLEGREEANLKPVGREVDRTFRMNLSGGMMSPNWTINGRVYPDSENVEIRQGERVRFEYFNMSMMYHPMHLHGHFFEVEGTGRSSGMRIKKDTLLISPHMGSGAIEFIADNPGNWFHHCHNLYHMMAGMANVARIK
jgi:FtsP/CotA-like multicopper oxidase with cupredoxin domain